LADVFDFFLPLGFGPYYVVETFLRPDPAVPSIDLVDPMSCAAFDAFQDLCEGERAEQAKERVRVIGHYYGRIEINSILVQRSDLSHYEVARPGRYLESMLATETHEVSSVWHFEVGQVAFSESQFWRFPGVH